MESLYLLLVPVKIAVFCHDVPNVLYFGPENCLKEFRGMRVVGKGSWKEREVGKF